MATSAAEVIRPLRRAFQDERIELLDGELVAMSPLGAAHSGAVQQLTRLLVLALEARAAVRGQCPFAALEFSEPAPDFTVVPSADYDLDHPSEAYLVVEVAESSLATDRGRKLPLYASCAVPEYGVVNLPERCVELYTASSPGSYQHAARYERGQSISLTAFPDLTFAASDFLK